MSVSNQKFARFFFAAEIVTHNVFPSASTESQFK